MAKKTPTTPLPASPAGAAGPSASADANGNTLPPSSSDNAVLDRLLDPVARCLTPESARELVALRADPLLQERLDSLADQCTQGELSPEERQKYETSVQAIHFIAILQAKARKLLARPPAA